MTICVVSWQSKSLPKSTAPSSKYLKGLSCVVFCEKLIYCTGALFSARLWFIQLLKGLPLAFDEKLMVMLFDKSVSFLIRIFHCNNSTYSFKMCHSFGLYKDSKKHSWGRSPCYSTSHTVNTLSCALFSLLNNVSIRDFQLLPWASFSWPKCTLTIKL